MRSILPSLPPAFLIGLSCILALGACTDRPPVPNVRLGYPIVVEMRPAELVVAPRPDGTLPNADIPRIKDFIEAWRDGGRGPLRIAIPERLDAAAQDRLLAQLAGVLRRRDADATNIMPVVASPKALGVVLAYDDFVAVAPACVPEDAAMTSRGKTVQTPAFGCATQRNIAAMVAHPADLIDPAASGDASAARGALVIQNHRLGNPTGATLSTDSKAVDVSKALQ
jgi:pilus assembly protein CpaD